MPELPEVEVTRRSFADRIRGARITSLRLGKPLRWPLGTDAASLHDQAVGEVTRRGKYLWLAVERGGLLMHLGMSGSLAFSASVTEPGAHDHFDLVTTFGTLRLTDPRRFGAVVWSEGLATGMAGKLLSTLGLEPFDAAFDAAYLYKALQRRRVAVKQALLGGDIVVGAGNIYACEALFSSRIDPRRPGDEISKPRCARLVEAIREVLTQALAAGGSTLRDFKDAHGMNGAFQLQAKVYGREGLPCLVCATPIARIVQAQRSTFFCPYCQRR
ncbi:MAG: formamidopyrimidine-DNA glycosylase [Rhizobacter sp.]|nr:formamidopyrimidine-DNA glycosylase [Rhizobacter sp.]